MREFDLPEIIGMRGVLNHCDRAFRYFGQSLVAPHFHGATLATHYYLHADEPVFRIPAVRSCVVMDLVDSRLDWLARSALTIAERVEN